MLCERTLSFKNFKTPVIGELRFVDFIQILAYLIVVTVFSVSFADDTHASSECKIEVARFVSIQGIIEVHRAQHRASSNWQRVDMDTVICLGDMIRSRVHSRAALRLSNNSMLRLDQRSSMAFILPEEEKKSFLMNLIEGAIHIITRTPKPFDIKTPFINATVNGTEFLVGVAADRGQVVVYEGKVTASNDYGSIALNDREAATATSYQAPQKTIHIQPIDAVHWALYYPTITRHWQSDLSNTHRILQQASDLLAVGQADEAQSVIQQVIQKQPDNSDAHALLAMIAVVQNNKEAARSHANQAIQLNAQSPVAYLALSYTQQAQFDIEAALASVNKALELDGRNALAWARLAELQMSTGETDRAIASAHQAVQLQPNLAKTQSVLGFAHLLQIDTDSAKQAFNQSIALDSSDPMPRLGLGLALIREGQLEAGRIQLEIAASLDPANSLIRSYLGKAYFEEKRYPLASTQFDLAKERDPKDPTPWLYDGIQKQTQNRPIEALQDIQKSIELNDNRAVYRSKFLLDRDEAARGSSLARIFETLGFERRAIMETAKSLSFDPANHSAHRFLSDTYARSPRHEAARVSELLQAQLLQPINVNPVQPHMAVADLNIITGTTPSAVSFNEFAPLMERNKPQIVASGIVGSNGTLGNEVVASMQRDRASVSVGQFHYETNGFRTNNDQNHNVYNGFFQYALTPKLNIQTEIRKRDTEHGYLLLDFARDTKDPLAPQNRFRRKSDELSARIGMKYDITQNQAFIFSGYYNDRKINDVDPFNNSSINTITARTDSGYQSEAQYLYRHNRFNTIAGSSFYNIDVDINRQQVNTLTNSLAFCCNSQSFSEQKINGYLYTNINVTEHLNTTLGFSYDSYSQRSLSTDNWNPKFGLQWNIIPNLRLRAAWIETTKSGLISQQTIEPTQVAGFNQIYDDLNGTHSRRIGIGIDGQYKNKIFYGFEASHRNLSVPIFIRNSHIVERQREELYRSYFNGVLNNYWSIRNEIQWENSSRNPAIDNLRLIDTLSIPTSINYFNPLGLFVELTGTFVRQKIDRIASQNEGTDQFFLVDAMIGYRLPNRRGIIRLEGRNIFNENFIYRNNSFTIQSVNPQFIPTRTIFANITFNF